MQQKHKVAQLVQALYGLGHLDSILDGAKQNAADYKFPSGDFLADMRLIPGIQWANYCAVVFAYTRRAVTEKPMFDAAFEGENPFEEMGPQQDTDAIGKVYTLEETLKRASAVARVCESAANTSTGARNNWLRTMTNKTHIKDAEGNWQASFTTSQIVVPFDVWLTQQLERSPVNEELHRVDPNARENVWPFALLEARQAGAHIPMWGSYKVDQHEHNRETPGQSLGATDAMDLVVNEWLPEEVFSQQFNRSMSRMERFVTKTSNNSWRKLVIAALAGDEAGVVKQMSGWSLLMYSPELSGMCDMIKRDSFYKREVALARLEKAVEQRTKLQLSTYPALVMNGTFKLTDEEVGKLPFEVQAAIIDAQIVVETKKLLADVKAISAETVDPKPEVETSTARVGNVRVYSAGQVPLVRRQQ